MGWGRVNYLKSLALRRWAVLDVAGLGGHELHAMRGMNESGWRRTGTPALSALLVILTSLFCAGSLRAMPERGGNASSGNLVEVLKPGGGAASWGQALVDVSPNW